MKIGEIIDFMWNCMIFLIAFVFIYIGKILYGSDAIFLAALGLIISLTLINIFNFMMEATE